MSDDPKTPANEGPTSAYDPAAINRARLTLDETPEQVGPYRILECLGQGGMGEVYRAEQRTPIRREVALKLIKLGMDTKQVIARFEAERQALALMDHPHIAKVYDASTDQGRPYFVMEYVKGKPITQYADQNHLNIPERLELFGQVCHAIQHAHHKGIIHRDIKPSNILVTTQDGKPHAKVIDFGIAKATATQLTEKTLYTLHDQFIGTPQYMSPEQAEGSVDIDTRTDVYSLGVLLYELLTGSTPFAGEDLKAAAIEKVKQLIRDVDPPKPSTRVSASGTALATLAAARKTEPKRLGTLMRGELDWIVMTALEKDRRRRYDSPNSLAEDVERYLKGEAVEAAPPSALYRAQKIYRRYRVALTAAAVLIGVLGLSTVLISGLALELRRQVRVANESRVKEESQRKAAEAARRDAESQSYINSIAAAQSAIESENWPEARRRLESSPVDQRGWEWTFLTAQASSPLFALPEQAHDCQITSSGRYLLVQHTPRLAQTNQGVLSLVDVETRKPIGSYVATGRPYPTYEGWYLFAVPAVSDGGHVAIPGDNDVDLYHRDQLTKKIELIDRSERGSGDVELAFSPGGAMLAITRGSDVYFYAVTDGSILGKVISPRQQPPIITHDDRYICVQASRTELSLHLTSGMEVRRFKTPNINDDVTTKGFSPDGKTLAVGFSSGKIILFDVATGNSQHTFSADALPILSLAFSPQGQQLITRSETKVGVWNVDQGEHLGTLRKLSSSPRFSSDGASVVGFLDGTIWSWRLGETVASQRRPTLDAQVRGYSDDALYAASIDNGRVRMWDTSQRSLHPTFLQRPSIEDSPDAVTVTLAGLRLSLDNWGGAMADVAATEAESGGELDYRQTALTAQDGSWLAKVGKNGDCIVTSKDGEELGKLRSGTAPVATLAVATDGKRLVTSGDDGVVRFWDTSNWSEVATFRFPSAVIGMGRSRDGNRLVLKHADNSLQVMDTRDGAVRDTADRQRAEERGPARTVAVNLLTRDANWTEVAQQVMTDHSLHPMRRIAILDELHRELQNAEGSITDQFNQLKLDWGLKSAIERELRSKASTPAQRAQLASLLEDWDQSNPDEIQNASITIAQKADSPRALVNDAHAAMKAIVEESPRIGFRNTLAQLKYRIDDLPAAVEGLTKGNNWIANEDKVFYWNAHSNNMAFLAMAKQRQDQHAAALGNLRSALCYWDAYQVETFSPLQREAAMLVCPQALDRKAPSPSPEFASLDALDAGDVDELQLHLGENGRVKGWVARVTPTLRGDAVAIILHPIDNGLNVFAWTPAGSDLNWSYFKELEGREIVVNGELANTPSLHATGWKAGRMQLEIFARDDIQVIGDLPHVPRWWEETAASKTAGVE